MSCAPIFYNETVACDAICDNGQPFIWTVPAGTVIGRTQAEANVLATSLACQRARKNKICFLTLSLPDGKVGVPYNATILAKGGIPWRFPALPPSCSSVNPTLQIVPYEFDVLFGPGHGPLPSGLSIGCGNGHSQPGQITGTPILEGLYTFNIAIIDATGAYQIQQFTIRITPDTGNDITPSVFDPTITWWNNGSNFPGFSQHRITYVRGAMKYGQNELWNLNINAVFGGYPEGPFGRLFIGNYEIFLANANQGNAYAGYYILHYGNFGPFANVLIATAWRPGFGTGVSYGSQALIEQANAGASMLISIQAPSPIGMLLIDNAFEYGDNSAGNPAPTFRLVF